MAQQPQQDDGSYRIKARGSQDNPSGRFAKSLSFYEPDQSIQYEDESLPVLETDIQFEQAKTIITKNNSPDVPFDYSVNPYRGCEHGCSYCFARPTHSYLDLSPGLDFEAKLFVKKNAPQLLVNTLANPRYQCQHFALGANTDCYQPIEKQFQLSRRILEICLAFKQPVTIITKGALLLRDLDLLVPLAEQNLLSVAVSVTTLNSPLKAVMEPRAASVQSRLHTIKVLTENKIPVTVLMAPVIPKINDQEMEAVLKTVADLGVRNAGYVMLRLPHELTELFSTWLQTHFPLKRKAVFNTIADYHQGQFYRAQFGIRQTGSGNYAELIAQRFHLACKKLHLNTERQLPTEHGKFKVPANLDGLLEPIAWQTRLDSKQPSAQEQLALF